MSGDAVVVGGGLAGMLAAAALLGHMDTVTVVERDRYPVEPAFRKGVPQGRHLHVLLTGGQRALEELLPGVVGELRAAGAHRLLIPRDLLTRSRNGWQRRYHEERHSMITCTRPVLDATVRSRVLAAAARSRTRVEVVQASEAVGLLGGAERVTGVRIRSRAGGRRRDGVPEAAVGVPGDVREERGRRGAGGAEERELPATLVVDASGRGSRAPRWFADLGRPAPREEIIDAGIGYTTQAFRPVEPLDAAVALQPEPGFPRGAAWFPVEDGIWLLTLSGVRGQHPPTGVGADGMAAVLDYVGAYGEPHLHDHLKTAEPVSPPYGFFDTANRRRFYQAPGGVPEGFIAVSDAACTFNPIYGQGMSVAALSAVALSRLLRSRSGPRPDRPGFAAAAQRAVARSGDTAWLTAVGADRPFAADADATPPSAAERLATWYFGRLADRAVIDRTVGAAFRDITYLTASPSRLLTPAVALRTVALPRRRGLVGPPPRVEGTPR
ncbi:NAD(P)/FAD-dependent oxidoreductase [Streptomyces sp. SAJ15]|uniref:NAD(P)/FAD-dependent oxidoreductase n=1 Tax=Streptomyces sp. SAJ15 TaxID=2011095 RepID=UPI001186359A|nr:hydroxylase [Streptomyces sp. SAJ15]TVL89686.1 hydroxylase [Streptomyces sp. SAJ15]